MAAPHPLPFPPAAPGTPGIRAVPGGGMAAEGAPPFALPGVHFAAGLAWLALGGAGLAWVAPQLAQGAWTAPHVVAVVHAFTLGWLTTSICGALYQLFPVALGVPARSVRLGFATFGLLQAGTAALVAGFWWWVPALLGIGWVLLCAAVVALAWNLFARKGPPPRGQLVARYVAGGLTALGLALALAFARVGTLLGWWSVDGAPLVATHVHLAALGFASLTIVGVGSRLLPMFLLAHGYPDWPLRWIGGLTGLGLLLFGAGELGGVAVFVTGGGALMSAAVALYLYQAWTYFRRRVRRVLDPGLALAALAHVFLLLALLTGVALLAVPGAAARLSAAYGVLALLGWLSLLVAGIYQKILPFLTWLHRFGPRVGEAGLPKVADLSVPAWGWASLGLLGVGTLALAAGTALGSEPVTRAGAALLAAGALVLGAQGIRLRTAR